MSEAFVLRPAGASAERRERWPFAEVRRDGESRDRLIDVPVALVEDLNRDRHEKTSEGFCDVFQVCFPYRGLGVWHVRGEDVVADSNQLLFVTAGEAYRLSGPVDGGYAELIITPDIALLSEIAGGVRPAKHPLFRRRAARASAGLQKLRARFLSWATASETIDDLAAEESVIALLRSALQTPPALPSSSSAVTVRLIRRTKEHLEANLSSRLRLTDVGRAVGASPAYLTDTFRRVEGVSLHRYLTQLRLAHALFRLPHSDDLTALALDCGFSSHSHFSSSFRSAFGCTPSEFRQSTRSQQRQRLSRIC